jgi:hypothetical protein
VYATVEDLRAEGLLPPGASDARAQRALAEASALIDVVTGQCFEPRTLVVSVIGRGAPTLWLPFPILRVDALHVGGQPASTGPDSLEVVGAPVVPGLDGPRITRLGGVFGCGQPIRIAGLWGYTEPDETPFGHTPYAVWRACLLLVARVFLPLAGDGDSDARIRSRIVSETTRDQSYQLADPRSAGIVPLTGDPDVDALLTPYLRRAGLGAA